MTTMYTEHTVCLRVRVCVCKLKQKVLAAVAGQKEFVHATPTHQSHFMLLRRDDLTSCPLTINEESACKPVE